MPEWSNVGFDDSRWMNVEKVPDATEKLSSQMIEPTLIIETIKPQLYNRD